MIKTGAIILLLLGDLNFTGLNFMAEFSKNGYNPEFPFNAAASVIQKADIAIANLEGPLTFADWSPESEKKGWRFRQLPIFAKAIRNSGIKILLLANNHIADAGNKGIKDTLTVLKDNNILWVPPPKNGPLIIEQNGIKLHLWNVDIFSPEHSHPWAINATEFVKIISKRYALEKEKYISIAFIHDHLNDKTQSEVFISRLRQNGIHWVIIGGEHKPAAIKTDSRGGVHYGLGDFIFGCECSRESNGRALALILNSEGFQAKEFELSLASPINGFVTSFDGQIDLFEVFRRQ